MHAISRNITKAAPAVSKISNLSEIKAVRCVATTTKNTAASAQDGRSWCANRGRAPCRCRAPRGQGFTRLRSPT